MYSFRQYFPSFKRDIKFDIENNLLISRILPIIAKNLSIKTVVLPGHKISEDLHSLVKALKHSLINQLSKFPKARILISELIKMNEEVEGIPIYSEEEFLTKIYDEEVFGPVACLDRQDTLVKAIEIINQNPKGNAVTIYTESGEEARFFRSEVFNIQVGVNIGVVAPLAWFPFAGAKDSFFGTLRAQGREVIQFFTQERVIIERFHGSTRIEWD